MYNVYPYMYRNPRGVNNDTGFFGQSMAVKRGDLEGYEVAKDFTSVPLAQCSRANAFAHIRENNNLRANMTPKEYINILLRQGQVPNKHFSYSQTDTGYEIAENNSYKEVTKRVVFNKPEYDKEIPIVCKYYTPETGRQFKEVRYHSDGKTETLTNYEDLAINDEQAQEQLERIEQLKQRPPKDEANPPTDLRQNPFATDTLPSVDIVSPPPSTIPDEQLSS